jgi:hypothetical protein
MTAMAGELSELYLKLALFPNKSFTYRKASRINRHCSHSVNFEVLLVVPESNHFEQFLLPGVPVWCDQFQFTIPESVFLKFPPALCAL